MNPESTIAALAGLLGGAAGTNIFKFLLARKGQEISNEEKLRKELQDQIDMLKQEILELRNDVNTWQTKYFEIYEEHIQLKLKLAQ